MLGSEYGWAKDEVLNNTYLDELYYLAERINQRKADDYKMRLAIAQNPFNKEPNRLWELLNSFATPTLRDDKFDEAGFELMKAKMRSGRGFLVKDNAKVK